MGGSTIHKVRTLLQWDLEANGGGHTPPPPISLRIPGMAEYLRLPSCNFPPRIDSRLHCKDRHLFAREYVYLTGHCLWNCASGDFASALALGACAVAVSAVLNLHMARERRRQQPGRVTTRYNGGVIRSAQLTTSKVSEKNQKFLLANLVSQKRPRYNLCSTSPL